MLADTPTTRHTPTTSEILLTARLSKASSAPDLCLLGEDVKAMNRTNLTDGAPP